MTAVVVRKLTKLWPIGDGAQAIEMETEWSMPHATADMFETGVLTISSVVTGEALERFPADRWRSASVLGADGYTEFQIVNPARDPAWAGHRASRVLQEQLS